VTFASYFFRVLPLPIFLLRALPYLLGFSTHNSSARSAKNAHLVKRGLSAKLLTGLLQSEIDRLQSKRPMRFGGSCIVAATKRISRG
jgi:hypothetical protein